MSIPIYRVPAGPIIPTGEDVVVCEFRDVGSKNCDGLNSRSIDHRHFTVIYRSAGSGVAAPAATFVGASHHDYGPPTRLV
jgi:hypothetical protein